MSLYQKYRPTNFEDVAGQLNSVQFLQNIITKSKKNESFPHAYIFSGSHGIGKTTLARIFAKDLGVNDIDIIELDAASTSRKIEDMRELIDSTANMPIMSKYKVYILDEAHALTKDSSNAFLKTLEEPFSTNIFILCTTNPDSLLPTVRSRCNIVRLQSPRNIDLIARLKYIVDKEKISILDKDINEVLSIIADNSNRSYRDAITNLERVIHTFNNDISNSKSINESDKTNLAKLSKSFITIENVKSLFVVRDNLFYKNIFVYCVDGDIDNLLQLITKVFASGESPDYNGFLDFIRGGILYRHKVKDYKVIEENILFYESIFDNNLTSEKYIKAFNSKNLLFFLEKEIIFQKLQNKEIAWISVCGNFIEER